MSDQRESLMVKNEKSYAIGNKLWDELSKTIDGFSMRPEQMEIYRAIVKSINSGSKLIIEGPCGVGKSLAYLIGFLSSQGRKVVICTANNSLLSQLKSKDLPTADDISAASGVDMDWIMLQGKGNYICPKRWSSVKSKLNLIGDKSMQEMVYYIDELDRDREHWLGHIEKQEYYEWIRDTLTIPSNRCSMSNCKWNSSCEMYVSRESSKICQVVVTNYHLWILDTMQRILLQGEPNYKPTLGDYDVLIFDEAHELPNVARDYFKLEIDDKFISGLLKHGEDVSKAMLRIAWGLYKGAFEGISDGYVSDYPVDSEVGNALIDAFDAIAKDIKDLPPSRKKDSHFKALEGISKRVSICRDAIVGNVTSQTHAYGIYRDEDDGYVNTRIECIELSAGRLLNRLYPKDIPIIATSATICTSPGNFNYMSGQLGFKEHDPVEIAVGSPFNFKRSMVMVMNDSPDPNADVDAWIQYCYLNLKAAILSLEGKVLALFTSTSRMGKVSRLLKADPDIGTEILCQGDMANSALTTRFRDERTSSLLGVSSFWTGVDISGDSLSLLWIERVPFRPPNDLIVEAMSAKMEGRKSFFKFSVPDAIVKLKQGAGRLVRSKSDRGIVVFADARVSKSKYGKTVLKSMLSYGKDNTAVKKKGGIGDLMKYCAALRRRLEKEQ